MSVLDKRMRPMRNEGARLVQKEIPVYPHSKLILTDEDGSGVADSLKRMAKRRCSRVTAR